MKTEKPKTSPTLEEVLTEFAFAQDKPDAALLNEFTRRFPAYAEQLIEYAVELAIEATTEAVAPTHTSESSAAAMRAMSRFQNRQFELQEQSPTVGNAAPATNPIASLGTSKLREITQRLNASPVLMMKLRDRLIRADTIPSWFKVQLASELGVANDIVDAHFAAPPVVAMAASFKADRKPQAAPKESFAEAIESSGLTLEQQTVLKGS